MTFPHPATPVPDPGADGRLAELPVAPELPFDRAHPARRDLRAGSVPFVAPAAATAALRQLGEACGAGLPAGAFALYLALLHRYGGQSELAVGVTNGAGVTTAVRADAGGSFRDLVRLAGARLAEAEQARTAAAVHPLPGFSCGPAPRVAPETTYRDLDLQLCDLNGELSGQLVFATDVLDPPTARRAVDHLLRLLAGATVDPDQPVAELPMLTPAEEHTIATLNGVAGEPTDRSFHQLVEEQAARTPEAIAVRAEGAALSYRELDSRANQLAHLLREVGVGPEVTVGLCADRDVRLMVAVLGILKAGGAYVPVDPNDPVERRDGILDDAAVRIVVATAPLDTGHRVIELDAELSVLAGRPTENPPLQPSACGDAAYLLYTSGSTGKPKGVVIEHRQLVSYTRAVIRRLGIDGPLRFAMVQPLTVDSSVTAFAPPLCTGGEVQLISRDVALDAGKLADWVQTWGVDCLKIAPSHLRALQSSSRFAELLPRRLLVIGGEASDWRWLRALQRLVPHCRVFNHYGPTETSVGVLTLAVADHPEAEWETAPIGVPLPGTQAHVVDLAGRPTPVGVVGELLIGGDNLARGYHRRDDLTAAAFVPDTLGGGPGSRLYRTGDIVRRLADGTIAFLGRRDDQVKVRGFRVALGEIEAALKSHPELRHAIVIVREDVPGDRQVVAYVEPHGPEFSTAGLERHLRTRLSPHMMPQAVVTLDRLPLSGHGKVDRSKLPRPTEPAATAPLPPRNELERLVAQMWQEVFHTETVGTDQNFFDLGGHSLLVVELHHRLRAATGREIELLDLFQHTTVRAQAELLSQQSQGAAPARTRGRGAQQNALMKRRQQQLQAKRGHHE
ncbi:Dimodular nonribosomal peptide synthase [Streptomyces sp. ADI95-16]|uniref:non-ribosomal peptide synthetase n=1 Tax=Streptomyces sp. ADI95-16 TaxID=1522758 RepID=UPI000F3A845B|nr:amino acid adenylation domain-containing protein [Streptomyces sp. ADI95-16]AYV31134.1 Dimodular nonribosomal peptide synthase [Streptomyces sp. ADI95-16]